MILTDGLFSEGVHSSPVKLLLHLMHQVEGPYFVVICFLPFVLFFHGELLTDYLVRLEEGINELTRVLDKLFVLEFMHF